MREHYHRTPPPVLRNGVPMPPKWMLIGSELLAVDDAQIVSVDPEEGRIVVRLVGQDGQYERFGSPDRKPGEVPDPQSLGLEPGGVRFWLTATSARELVLAVASRTQPEDFENLPLPSEPSSPEFDVTQVAGFEHAHLAEEKLQYLFLRALDAPYSLRIALSPASAARFVVATREALASMTRKEQDAVTEPLMGKIEVGPRHDGSLTEEKVEAKAVGPAPSWLTEAQATAAALAGAGGASAPTKSETLPSRLSQASYRLADRIFRRFGL